MWTPIVRAPKYTEQILMDIKGEMDNNAIIGEDFNTPLTSVDRSTKQKTNTKTVFFFKFFLTFNFVLRCSWLAMLWVSGEQWRGSARHMHVSILPQTPPRLREQTYGCLYTLLYLKWITKKDQLYSTWNSAQCFEAVWVGGKNSSLKWHIRLAGLHRCL